MAGADSFHAPPEAYDRHAGRYSPALAAEMIALAEIRAGQRALDVGCGPGGLTKALAETLGAEAVAAIDPSPPFVDACRRRVPGADVRLGGAEELPFGDLEFDAVLSQLVVNFMTDPVAAAREMRRVAKPGALVAACTWDYAEGMTLLRRFWDAARLTDPEGAAQRDEADVMRFSTPSELEGLWRDAGLEEVASGELNVHADYDGFGDLWEPLESGVGPAGAYAVALDSGRRATLRRELYRLLGSPEGPFTLSARAWYVKGRVAA
jgi:SAM-dependent methyltransferase